MTKRYAAIFPRVISCCPKSSGQNRDRGQSYYGDSNCRELDVSIDNGWQGSKVYSPRSLSIEYPNKARTEDPPARLPPGNPFQALTASEFTLQDQQLRHEPTAGTWMDVSVNGFAATPVCLSKAKGRVGVDADVGFTFAYDTGLLPNHLFRFKEEKGSRTMIKRGL